MANKKTISSSTLLLILSGAVAVLLIVLSIMQMNSISRTSKKIDEERVVLENTTSQLKNLRVLESARAEMEKASAILDQAIPQKPDPADIISQLSSLSDNSGSNFISIEFSDLRTKNNLTEIPIKISFSGSYTSLVTLLEQWTLSERLMRINEILFSKTEDAMNNIKAEIQAVAFSK